MNNNNLQKRYFSPKRVFLYSAVALVHVLYAQACNDSTDAKNVKGTRTRRFARSLELDRSATMTGKKEYESTKNGVGRVNDDSFIDSVYAKNNAEENSEPDKSEYEDIYGFTPETIEDFKDEVDSSYSEDPIFRDVISERSGQRGSGIPMKGEFDRDQGIDVTFENDTEQESGSKQVPSKFWPGFETEDEIKDPFNRNKGVFNGDRRYEIPGLMQSNAVMTKFSVIFCILILSVFLFVKVEVFI